MIEFPTDCESCKANIKMVEKETTRFLLDLVQALAKTEAPRHMPPHTFMLVVLATVGEVLGHALRDELKTIISRDDKSDAEKEIDCDKMVKHCVTACFDIIEDAMPIAIHSMNSVKPDDMGVVLDLVDALNKKPNGGATH